MGNGSNAYHNETAWWPRQEARTVKVRVYGGDCYESVLITLDWDTGNIPPLLSIAQDNGLGY